MEPPPGFGPPVEQRWIDAKLINIYKDVYADDDFTYFVDVHHPVKTASQDAIEQQLELDEQLDMDGELMDNLEEERDVDAGLEAPAHLRDTGLLQSVLNSPTAAAITAPQPAASKPTSSMRWGAPKANTVDRNPSTARVNKTATKAFQSWLQDTKDIDKPLEDMEVNEFAQHVAEYVLVARQQNGEEYKRDSLITNIYGIIRKFNYANADRHLQDPTMGPYKELKINDFPLVENNLEAACRHLHKIGKGSSDQQQGADPEEQVKLVNAVKEQPPSSWKHQCRTWLIFSQNWGGRASEYQKIKSSMVRKGTNKQGVSCIIFTPPSDIKQLQGGLTKSRGQRELEKNKDINMYANNLDPFLCPLDWWNADQAYKQDVVKRINGKKALCDHLLLQLGHSNGKRKAAGDDNSAVVYLDYFQNSPFGKEGVNRLCDKMCDLAGIDRRTNHGLGRRTLIENCYAVSMPEHDIKMLSRHKSDDGVRAYSKVHDAQMLDYANRRNQLLAGGASAGSSAGLPPPHPAPSNKSAASRALVPYSNQSAPAEEAAQEYCDDDDDTAASPQAPHAFRPLGGHHPHVQLPMHMQQPPHPDLPAQYLPYAQNPAPIYNFTFNLPGGHQHGGAMHIGGGNGQQQQHMGGDGGWQQQAGRGGSMGWQQQQQPIGGSGWQQAGGGGGWQQQQQQQPMGGGGWQQHAGGGWQQQQGAGVASWQQPMQHAGGGGLRRRRAVLLDDDDE